MSAPTFDAAVAALISELSAAFGVITDDKAAAFFAGITLDQQIVQETPDGTLVVNTLRLAQWLKTFDTTLVLKPGQSTTTLPPGGASGSSATGLYTEVVNGARPIDPGGPAGLQLLRTIAADRGLFEQVATDEPVDSQPPDWPLPDAPSWQTSTVTHTVPPPPPDANPPNTAVAMPTLPGGQGLVLTWLASVGDPVVAGATLAIAATQGAATEADITSPVNGTVLKISTPASKLVPTGTQVCIVGPAPDDAEVVIELDHALILLTRQASGTPWWDDQLLADPTWFIPGRSAGGLLPTPAPGFVNALPYAVLMVKNVVVSGPDGAPAVTRIGPIQGVAVAGSPPPGAAQPVRWPAMQAIGVIARVLPGLPPNGDPGLPASALITVPDFTRGTLGDAKALADAFELSPTVVAATTFDAVHRTPDDLSRVVHQSPRPGAQVARGSVVNVAT